MNVEFHRTVGDGDDVLTAALGGIKRADLHGGISTDVDGGGIRQIQPRKRLLAGHRKRVVRENELAGDIFGGRAQAVPDLALNPLESFVLRRDGRLRHERSEKTERQNACRTITKGRGTYAT